MMSWDTEPAAARVILHIEYADGRSREFEAVRPHSLEMAIRHPQRHEVIAAPPLLVPSGFEPTSVSLSFEASRDLRHPMMLRTETDTSPQAKLAAIRAWAATLGDEGPDGRSVLAGEVLAILDRP